MNRKITQDTIIRVMNRAIKKEKKENPDKPNKIAITIKGMCQHDEENGKPNYFTQIRNRIERECAEDKSLYEYVLLSPSDLEDIKLTADGVLMFSDILISYFGKDEMLKLYRYMRSIEKLELNKLQLRNIIKTMSTQDLIDIQPTVKDNADCSQYIENELKSRKCKFRKIKFA